MKSAAELPALDAARVRRLVDVMSRAAVLVVGDVMLDEFLIGRVERISPEAPVPIVAFEREEVRLGGAANVACNVAALGGAVQLVGVTGADDAGERIRVRLQEQGLDTRGLVADSGRRTTRKVRLVTTRNQQVARIDYETDEEIIGSVERTVLNRVTELADDAGALVVSDYLKGTVTLALMERLLHVSRARRIPLLVDPKIPHLDFYAGATLVTPNHHEAEIATHRRIRTDDDARAAAEAFRQRVECDGVLITRGEHGMWLLDGSVEGQLPAVAREVADVTGAGDTVIAALALALAAGATASEAAWLANQAAGVVVGKFGPATVSSNELLAACMSQAVESA
ncbi:MAG TPA: D-glycero-beta-D-manno-heptose-7-phosphate kinase [Vicinamibacterales bacterium]|nr:D-glycero-beta-D-manno-heptose-7-phosphate kinase [Vicinamibacterales bacterium]